MDWNLFAWIKRGETRKKVLKIIQTSKNPITINEIKEECKISISQCSLIVKQLEEKKLIECLNPKDKIGKLYRISKIGKEIINEVNMK